MKYTNFNRIRASFDNTETAISFARIFRATVEECFQRQKGDYTNYILNYMVRFIDFDYSEGNLEINFETPYRAYDIICKIIKRKFECVPIEYAYFCPEHGELKLRHLNGDEGEDYCMRNAKLNGVAARLITEIDPYGLDWEEVHNEYALSIHSTMGKYPFCTFSIKHYEGDYPDSKLIAEHYSGYVNMFDSFDNEYKRYRQLLNEIEPVAKKN